MSASRPQTEWWADVEPDEGDIVSFKWNDNGTQRTYKLRQSFSGKWRDLGKKFGFADNLDVFATTYRDHPEHCFDAVISLWKSNGSDPPEKYPVTWWGLVEALEDVGDVRAKVQKLKTTLDNKIGAPDHRRLPEGNHSPANSGNMHSVGGIPTSSVAAPAASSGPSTPNVAAETFRSKFPQLVQAVEDPSRLADELYASKLISGAMQDDMSTLGVKKYDKSRTLMMSLQTRLQNNPSDFEATMRVFKNSTALSPGTADQLIRQSHDPLKTLGPTSAGFGKKSSERRDLEEEEEEEEDDGAGEPELDRKISPKDVQKIADKVLDWRRLAGFMNISATDQARIEESKGNARVLVINHWQRKLGRRATFQALVAVAIEMDDVTMAEVIENVAKKR